MRGSVLSVEGLRSVARFGILVFLVLLLALAPGCGGKDQPPTLSEAARQEILIEIEKLIEDKAKIVTIMKEGSPEIRRDAAEGIQRIDRRLAELREQLH